MLLGPAVLIILRIYLQMYVEHERRLDHIARRMSAVRAPTLAPDKNPLMRTFIGFAFYLLLPLVMLAFFLKAAVFAHWGTALLVVAAAVIAMHLMLPLRRLSWRLRTILSLGAAILTGGLMLSFGPWHRPFHLFRANLSDQHFIDMDLKGANLEYANLTNGRFQRTNLTGANLTSANLTGANLRQANLTGADLSNANLTDAYLFLADLSTARLTEANLTGANLSNANLTRANLREANLTGANLSNANLTDAFFFSAVLSNANLTDANLTGANLRDANLTDAVLSNANLTDAFFFTANLTRVVLFGADLSKTNLRGANIRGADLSNARGLTQQNLDTACGDHATKLPAGLRLICSD
jgi:uncharacterized protein YjbI with pentapeptide repeats